MVRGNGLSALLGCLALVCGAALAEDWPRFRGVEGSGRSGDRGLLRGWGEEGPAEAWRRAIGDGFSGMSVVGDRLYTTEVKDGEQRVVALEATTGRTVWSVGFGTDYRDSNGFGHGARSTPTVDGDTLYTVSADSVLLALATQDGSVRWRCDLKERFGAEQPRFGYGASPVVLRDLLIVVAGGPDGKSIVALKKDTGELAWSSMDDPARYATPIVVTLGGREQLVLNRPSGLVALAADTGEALWSHPSAQDAIVMPVFFPPDRFFISAATTGGGGHMVRVKHGEGGFSATTEWSNPLFRNHFNNSVAVDGFLYGFDNATFRCVDVRSGQATWSRRGYGKGSVVAADGLLFVLSDRGLLALVEATPEEFRELGRVQATEGRSWTSPTLANGRLYLRDHDEMVAYDLRAGAPAGQTTSAVPAPSTRVPGPASSPDAQAELTAAVVAARYAEARGGKERWKEIQSLKLTGRYSAFSRESAYTELHRRTPQAELFRLEYWTLGGDATWARDADGLWWIFPLLEIMSPSRLEGEMAEAYRPQLERRSLLEPLLLRWKENGIQLELLGSGRIGDRETVDLKVTLADGQIETWHLDPVTWLEVAVDSQVHDFSQMAVSMTQRAFFSDFRTMDGIVLPFQTALEFGARLEEIVVEEVTVDEEIDVGAFASHDP